VGLYVPEIRTQWHSSTSFPILYPAFLVILLVTGNIEGGGEGGWMETTGKMCQIEITGNSLLYWSRTT